MSVSAHGYAVARFASVFFSSSVKTNSANFLRRSCRPHCARPVGWAGYFVGDVRVTGTVVQGSDARLKQNVANIGYGLREILQLRPVTWNWKDRPDKGRHVGLIAQEVETVLPEFVSTDKDAERTKGLNYLGLVPVTIKAIQEQQAQIEAQEKRNAEQQDRISEQQGRFTEQQEQLEEQRRQIDGLKLLVCHDHPEAAVCK